MIYIWFSALLEGLPRSILRVLDANDVFSNRNERIKNSGINQQWFSVTPKEEARALQRFDVVMAIQEHEAEFFRTLSTTKVVTVGHFLPTFSTGAPTAHPNLLFIGSGNAINVDGIKWFLDSVWPSILANRPDAKLRIVGTVGEALEPQPNVIISGAMQHLDAAYADTRIVVNPLRGGTGLKIKAAEALAAGRVVVSTASAAEGIETALGQGLIIADNAESMAETIISLLEDELMVKVLSESARQFATNWNTYYARVLTNVFLRSNSNG
jgi:glycosyltransferase involved in cell wall biosynthesis